MSMKKLKSSVIVSVAAFFAIFFIFCGFAIDFTLMLVSRLQLQNAVETAALSSLDESEEESIRNKAQRIFDYSCVGGLKNAKIDSISVKSSSRAVLIKAVAPVQPFFLSALGIHVIEVQARAAARGVFEAPSADGTGTVPPNHKQYKTDKPFLSRKSVLYVERGGVNSNRDIRVFVGLSDVDDQYANLRWVEVTCSAHEKNGNSAWYNIDDNCIVAQPLGAARYIRLALNNTSPPNYYWDEFNIDEISVLTSVRLIRSSAFNLL